MHDKILKILQNIRPDIDFEKEQGLITDELIDSFDMVVLLDAIMKQFSVEIDVEEITVEHFDSLENIACFVEQIQKEKQK